MMNFEDTLKELEAIAEKLEKGECTLEESVAAYDRAAGLAQSCEKMLQEAKLKMEDVDSKVPAFSDEGKSVL